jgi:hypothetical protein
MSRVAHTSRFLRCVRLADSPSREDHCILKPKGS